MFISAFVLTALIPLQVSPYGHSNVPIGSPIVVGAYVDASKILGLPKFRLRDDQGKLYVPNKAMLQEPLAQLHEHAGLIFPVEINQRKAYIQTYVRR
jgi:hypothetical protein